MTKGYALALALVATCAAGAWAAGRAGQEGFPHEQHEGLFPLCESCHAGILSGDATERFPAPGSCASCHDGEQRDRVAWSGPAERASSLVFDHREHVEAVESSGDPAECQTCHGTDPAIRMAVGAPRPETCLTCHAHEAPAHLSMGRDCASCHLALAQADALAADRIAAFPRPASHDDPGFLSAHEPRLPADRTACATCHARESCTRCHVNAESVPAIMALEVDARVADLVRDIASEYPVPPTHETPSWVTAHGVEAPGGSCANCHARASCRSCHRESEIAAIAALPATDPDDARGVRADTTALVHDPMFATMHAIDGSARQSTCESCHATAFCESCHAGPEAPGFHGTGFLVRHAPEAWANEQDCASCHNNEVFCQACHSGLGLGSTGRNAVGFHSSNPAWIFGHGQAARQGMDGCITCHAQTTCLQCHSAKSGWRISPHGPGFDAIRLRNANQLMCRRCHLSGDIFR